MTGNHQKVHVDYFFNNDIKYLQGGVMTMTYTTSITKTKAAQYDLPRIKDMVSNIWSPVKVAYHKHALWGISHQREQQAWLFKASRRSSTQSQKYPKKINVTKLEITKSRIRKRDPYTPYQDPHRFIYADDSRRNRLMCSDELCKFSDGTLTTLRTSLGDITKNIQIEYLPKNRWSTLEKKRANIMIKAIDKQQK
uniref:Uncharacterized protein n=1 Tax=Tanacetum cinerariifolium TaxID=118510 RepID=A0A699J788_TANCI|nr:hypothetical protein [Tanacetum cinerariifolium]